MAAEKKISRYFDFMAIDIITLICSFILSYFIKFKSFGFYNNESWMPLFFIICLIDVVICLFSDPYTGIFNRAYYEEIIKSILLVFYNLVATSIVFYVFKIGFVFSRQMILTMYGIYFILSLIFKCIWKKLVLSEKIKLHNTKKISLLIVCNESDEEEVIRNAKAGDFNSYDIKCICHADKDETLKNLDEYALQNGINEILIASAPSVVGADIYDRLIKNGIGIHFSISDLLGIKAEDYEVSAVGVNNSLSVGRYSFTQGQVIYLFIKRIIDIIAGVLGALVLIPITLAVKVMCLATGDTKKIFYRQIRVGKNGKEIKIFKFRTMVPDADEKLKELLKDEKIKAEWDANQKLANDPRITKIGKILRKTSIDELPQLINVLNGEMSLVGPRPLVPGELEAHGGMKFYQMVKPGITGWWGCNGRSNIEYNERLELEYYYVKNFSIYLDFLCVLRTVLTIIKREGAE